MPLKSAIISAGNRKPRKAAQKQSRVDGLRAYAYTYYKINQCARKGIDRKIQKRFFFDIKKIAYKI